MGLRSRSAIPASPLSNDATENSRPAVARRNHYVHGPDCPYLVALVEFTCIVQSACWHLPWP